RRRRFAKWPPESRSIPQSMQENLSLSGGYRRFGARRATTQQLRSTSRSVSIFCTVRRILIVDDEENIRLVLRTLLRRHGYEVEAASSGEEALPLVESF